VVEKGNYSKLVAFASFAPTKYITKKIVPKSWEPAAKMEDEVKIKFESTIHEKDLYYTAETFYCIKEVINTSIGAQFARACAEWLHRTKKSKGIYFFMSGACGIRAFQNEGFTIRHRLFYKDFLYQG
jgi:hypothetical protein